MKKTIAIAVLLATLATTQAEPGQGQSKERKRHESHNYILERQQIGAVKGPPTSRLIIGRREIDIYPNGMRFEKNNLVGVSTSR
jgi:hypothetical protein